MARARLIFFFRSAFVKEREQKVKVDETSLKNTPRHCYISEIVPPKVCHFVTDKKLEDI